MAAAVSKLILNGTAESILVEGLKALPQEKKMITIQIDPDDTNPLDTARFILERAGVNTRKIVSTD